MSVSDVFQQFRTGYGTSITYNESIYAAITKTVDADIIAEYIPTNNADGLVNAANSDPRVFNVGDSIFASAEGNTLTWNDTNYRMVRVTPVVWQKTNTSYRLYCYRIVEHTATPQDQGTVNTAWPTTTTL